MNRVEKTLEEVIDEFTHSVQYEAEANKMCEAPEKRFCLLNKQALQTYKWAKNYAYVCALVQSYFLEQKEPKKSLLN